MRPGWPSSPKRDDVKILFVRYRTGLRTTAVPCGHGTGARMFCRSAVLSSLTRSVFARQPCGWCGLLPSLRSEVSPHRGDFHPYATPILGLGRSILFNHRLCCAMAKCSRPTVFRVPPLLTGLSGSITFLFGFHLTGDPASGLVRGRFPSTRVFLPCHSGWRYLRP